MKAEGLAMALRWLIDRYPMACGLCMLAAALTTLWLGYRLLLPGELAGVEPRHAGRVTEEEMAALEGVMGGGLPRPLREAYVSGDVAHILMPAMVVSDSGEYRVIRLLAADAQGNRELVEEVEVEPDAFVVAADDFGNLFFVRADGEDVYYWDHDGGDVSLVFQRFEDFCRQLPGIMT